MHAAILLTLMAIGQIYNYPVTYDGLTFPVNGVKLADGSIRFDWSDAYNAQSYAAAKAARPVARPIVALAQNFGLDHQHMRNTGYKANSPEAMDYVAKVESRAAEDSGTPTLRLTVIGSPEERAVVIKDFRDNHSLSTLRGKVAIQEYGPDEWAVTKDLGFRHGKPAIYLQHSGGRVLWRATDYSHGPEGLAGAIRKASDKDPYDDDRAPGPDSIRSSCPLGFSRRHWPLVVCGAALVGLILLPAIRTSRRLS